MEPSNVILVALVAVVLVVLALIGVTVLFSQTARFWQNKAEAHQTDLGNMLGVLKTMSPGPETDAAVARFNESSENTLDPNRILRDGKSSH